MAPDGVAILKDAVVRFVVAVTGGQSSGSVQSPLATRPALLLTRSFLHQALSF